MEVGRAAAEVWLQTIQVRLGPVGCPGFVVQAALHLIRLLVVLMSPHIVGERAGEGVECQALHLPPPAPAEVPGFAKDGGKNVKVKDGKEKNVVPVSTAEYGCSNWKWWLNNTTITLGMQNVTDADPPFVAGSFENGYDETLATIKGRFWYVGLKKRF